MPDLDRFVRTFQVGGWRGAYRRAREAVASTEEVGDKLVKALAKTLRANGGVPELPAMAEIIEPSNGTSLLERFSALDAIVRAQDGHRHTKIASDVAKTFLVQQDATNGGSVPSNAVSRLGEEVCAALVEHYFFANARQHLITQDRLANHEEARRWQSEVERAIQPDIEKVARQLVQDPGANHLRAPKGIVKKESTSTLLEEELVHSQPGVPA